MDVQEEDALKLADELQEQKQALTSQKEAGFMHKSALITHNLTKLTNLKPE